jgi:5-methylcytosine-specific restriction endonuclease McrA
VVDNIKTWRRNNAYSPNDRYNAAKSQANERKIKWGLTKEEYFKLNSLPCFYCQEKLPLKGGGLDRLDNAKDIGYIASNLVPCCADCNSIKGNKLTYQEMQIVAKALKEYRNG